MGVRPPDPDAFEPDESILEAMAAWGAPAEDIAAVRSRIEAEAVKATDSAETFGVYADNLATVHAFQAVSTQWQYAGFGQRVGYLYAGVIAWINFNVHRRRRRALLADLQVMERAVLGADHELREKKE